MKAHRRDEMSFTKVNSRRVLLWQRQPRPGDEAIRRAPIVLGVAAAAGHMVTRLGRAIKYWVGLPVLAHLRSQVQNMRRLLPRPHQNDASGNPMMRLTGQVLCACEARDAPAATDQGRPTMPSQATSRQVHRNRARRRPRIIQRPNLFENVSSHTAPCLEHEALDISRRSSATSMV